MQYYVNHQVPLWTTPKMSRKHFDIPLNAFAEVLRYEYDFAEVRYNAVQGYVETRWLERYERVLAHNVVDLSGIQTASTTDFEQYIEWKGVRQVNMCGEMCAAAVFGVGLEAVLINWEVKHPTFFRRIFRGSKATGTSVEDLKLLFEIYGMDSAKFSLKKYTPTAWHDLTQQYDLICGVKMNAITGELRRGSVPHWVLLREVTLERKNMGWVTVYNPAQNCEERYSWSEWLLAAGVPSGVMIEKDTTTLSLISQYNSRNI